MSAVPQVEILLNNSGSTPAINIGYYCGCALSTAYLAQDFACPETVPYALRLPTVPATATETRELWCQDIVNRINEFETAELLISQDTTFGEFPQLVLWGTVLYDDVFGSSYRSDFAFMVHPRSSGSLSIVAAPQRSLHYVSDRRDVVEEQR